MPDRSTTLPTDDDPMTIELELADVLTVLRLLERAGTPPGLGELEAAAAVRVDQLASAALFPAGSAIAGLLPAILGTTWQVLGRRDGAALPVKVRPVP